MRKKYLFYKNIVLNNFKMLLKNKSFKFYLQLNSFSRWITIKSKLYSTYPFLQDLYARFNIELNGH